VQNDALLLKHLHKFYYKADVPWMNLIWSKHYSDKVPHATREVGSFWWKDVQRLSTIFRNIARCSLDNGTTVTFWDDLWTDDVLAHCFPGIFSYARNPNISVNEVMSAEDLDTLFALPISQEAFEELQMLSVFLQSQAFDEDSKDIWTYQWGSATYSSSKFYKVAFQSLSAHPVFTWLWKSKCTPRVTFFAWLILVDRLNTKTMLRRRNLFTEDDDHCVLCTGGIDEDLDHLFFECPFSRSCWEKIGIQWDTSLNLYPRIIAHTMQQQNIPFSWRL
jgi:hypothetical protein